MIRINGGQATLGANTFTGAQVAPSLALGGATIGSNALAVTGATSLSSGTATFDASGNAVMATATIGGQVAIHSGVAGQVLTRSTGLYAFSANTTITGGGDTAFSRISAGIIGVGTGAAGSIAGGLQAATLALGGASGATLAVTGTANISGATTMAAFAATGTSSVIGSTTIAGAASGNATATFRVFGGLSNSAGFQVAHNSATDASLILNTVAGGTLGIGSNNAAVLTFAATTNAVAISTSLTLGGVLTVPGVTTAALTSTGTFTSGAGAQVGTLTNAPAAGNPTTWIKIIDNGTTRYIPAW